MRGEDSTGRVRRERAVEVVVDSIKKDPDRVICSVVGEIGKD